ncbi:MAG: MraY family glycosyltransferase [Vicinamibacterales bacterium]
MAAVPTVGGLAVVGAAALAVALVGTLVPLPAVADAAALAPLLAGGLLVFGVGLADDIRPLSPWTKLGVEVVAAGVAMTGGLLVERVTVAGVTWQLGLLAWPVTLLWIVGLTNAFNLIDGVDGLAAGVAAIGGSACTVILVLRGHAPEALILSALVGAALGFLVYNFSPASIFLGDGGSLLFGFVLAATAITGWQKGATALAAGVPLLIFALPIADTASALGRRLRGAGDLSVGAALRQVVQPDRGHIHHRLLALGWSTRGTVVFLYAVTLGLSLLALVTARFEQP